MADLIQTIKGVKWFTVGRDFDYMAATENFLGLRLFPLIKTAEFKVAIQQLMDGSDLPVMAVVHALDTEAKIGDRVNFEEFKTELFLIKEKLNQGEALRKKIKDSGMSNDEKALIVAIYNDARNLVSRIITRLEVMACELLATGKITIKENNVDKTIDFNVPANNKLTVLGWATASHDIIGDLIGIQNKAKNKIRRAITSSKIMGYMLQNTAIINIAKGISTVGYPTINWLKQYLLGLLDIEFVTYDEEYKQSALSNTSYRFFDEDAVSFLTTRGTLGQTVCTTTPAEDFGAVEATEKAIVTLHTEEKKDPNGIWTIAQGVGLPVLANPKGMYLLRVKS